MSKRTVSTDALETLGTIIGPNEKRDAIHLAVLPVVAGTILRAGEAISIVAGVAHPDDDGLGIVDPFLGDVARRGDRFWMVLRPRLVTSLRHVWSHPEFPDEPGVPTPKEESRQWLEAYAQRLFSYEPENGSRLGYLLDRAEYGTFGTDIEGPERSPTDEFWFHFERYTGRKVVARPDFFSCSC